MSLRSRIVTWWRAIFRGAQFDAQVEEELCFHIESYAEDLMRSGLPRHEATRRARAELGSIAARKENCRAAWGTRIFDELAGDLRFAMRMLAKSPGFVLVAACSPEPPQYFGPPSQAVIRPPLQALFSRVDASAINSDAPTSM